MNYQTGQFSPFLYVFGCYANIYEVPYPLRISGGLPCSPTKGPNASNEFVKKIKKI